MGRASSRVGHLVVLVLVTVTSARSQAVFAPGVTSTHPLVGDLSQAVVLGDLDGDGAPDVLRQQVFGMATQLNQGDGTFGPPVVVPDLIAPLLVDFDGDGLADAVGIVPGPAGGDDTLGILPGDGTGALGPATTTPLVTLPVSAFFGPHPMSVQTADVDLDGDLDVIVGSGGLVSSPGTVDLYLGRGDGTLAAGENVLTTTVFLPSGPILGDVDGDGRKEIVSAGSELTHVDQAWVIDVDGQGGTTVTEVALPEPVLSTMGDDLDGDGILDLVAWSFDRLVTLPGLGDGTWGEALVSSEDRIAARVLGSDFDGDGRPDLLGEAVDAEVTELQVWLGTGDGHFAPGVVFGSGFDLTQPAVGDLDGDGRADTLAASFAPQQGDDVLVSYFNATYPPATPFEDMGGAMGLPSGHPIQLAGGRLEAHTPYTFDAHQLPPEAEAWFVVGFGTTLPGPAASFDAVVGPLPTGPEGRVSIAGAWPNGVPAGLSFYTQFWTRDAEGTLGCTSTVHAATP